MDDVSCLTVTQQNGVSIIAFNDPTILDAYHVNEVSKHLFDLIDKENYDKIILDLASIKMISSQTLSVFLKMRQKLEPISGKMVISGVNPGLYRVFRITNLHTLFEFFESNDDALAAF